ncbi:MAG: AmmeMemoRadiSam system protein B, partial [Candidatus Margulisiibacteriota bacterium]
LGPSHQVYSSVLAVPDADSYETPLGVLPFNQSIYQTLVSKRVAEVSSTPHLQEHSLEVQFPFLQIVSPSIQIVPISVGSLDMASLRKAGEAIASLLSPEIILIISTDLSHYHTLALAESIDKRTVNAILAMESLPLIQASQTKDMECCGLYPILLAFEIFKHFEKKPTATSLYYDTSATASFDDQHVVGYVSIAFS